MVGPGGCRVRWAGWRRGGVVLETGREGRGRRARRMRGARGEEGQAGEKTGGWMDDGRKGWKRAGGGRVGGGYLGRWVGREVGQEGGWGGSVGYYYLKKAKGREGKGK